MRRIFLVLAILLFATNCATATVPTDASRVAGPYACDGEDTTFTWTFGIIDDDDLEVILIDANDAETTLTKTTDYSISSANVNDPLDFRSAGTVTTVETYSSDYTIRLQSDTARTQLTNIDDEVMEESLDKITYMIQDLYAYLARLSVDVNWADLIDFDPDDWEPADANDYQLNLDLEIDSNNLTRTDYVLAFEYKQYGFEVAEPNVMAVHSERGDQSFIIPYPNRSGYDFTISSIYAVADVDDYQFSIYCSASLTDVGTANDTLVDTVTCSDDGTGCYYKEETTLSSATWPNDTWLIFKTESGEPNTVSISWRGRYVVP